MYPPAGRWRPDKTLRSSPFLKDAVMAQPGFWEYHRSHVNLGGFFGLVATSLTYAGVGWLRREQARSIENAFVLNAESLEALENRLKCERNSRVYVKLSGHLTASQPIEVPVDQNTSVKCVVKDDYFGYVWIGQPEPATSFEHFRSISNDPCLQIPRSKRVYLSPRCLSKTSSQASLRDSKTFLVKNVLSRIVLPLPFRDSLTFTYPKEFVHRIQYIPDQAYHFAALDAVLDSEGRLTLVPPIDPRRTAELSSNLEDRVVQTNHSTARKNFIIASICAGLSIIPLGFYLDIRKTNQAWPFDS